VANGNNQRNIEMKSKRVVEDMLAAMKMQEERQAGTYHMPSHAFAPVWENAKAEAQKYLDASQDDSVVSVARYNAEPHEDKTHAMGLKDERHSRGQVSVEVSPLSDKFSVLDVLVEVQGEGKDAKPFVHIGNEVETAFTLALINGRPALRLVSGKTLTKLGVPFDASWWQVD
jgi:hypothetical protein